MQQMENKYRDPESKNKLKQLKADAQKQIERNKIILKDFINRYKTCNAGRLWVDPEAIPRAKTPRDTCREVRWTTGIWAGGRKLVRDHR